MQRNLYICGRVVRIDPLMNEETRTPLPTTFCSGLQKTGKMKTIQLTKGQFALVDDEDYDFLIQWKWCALKGTSSYYAVRSRSLKEGTKKFIFMHRSIMNSPEGLQVDHKDHDGLNNQRSNLRNCTRSQNHQNKRPQGVSKYLGVSKHGDRGWRAKIKYNGRYVELGHYKSEELAARIYDREAKIHFGEFANLNFPNKDNNTQPDFLG